MSMQGSEGDSPSEVSALALGHGHVVAIEMFLGQAKVHNIDLSIFFVHYKVRSLDISVNKTTLMDTVDSSDHLHENLNRYFEVVALVEAPPGLGQVDSKQIHHNEVLLGVLDVLVCICDVG